MCFNEQVNTDLTIWVDTLQCRRHEGLTGCKKPQTSCAREKETLHQTSVQLDPNEDARCIVTNNTGNKPLNQASTFVLCLSKAKDLLESLD